MARPEYKVLKKNRPNGWFISLLQYGEGETAYYEVVSEGAPDPGYGEESEEITEEFDDFQMAEARYEELRKQLGETPNWALQARYDEEHGTDNGYPIYPQREC